MSTFKRIRHTAAGLLAALLVTASALTSVPALQAAAAEAPSASKDGVIPSAEYSPVIYTTDDYLLAVQKTARTNEEVQSVRKAIDNYVPAVDNSKLKYFPKIRNQKGPTCIVWGSVYYQFTHQVNRALDREATDAATMNPVFTYNLYNYGTWRHPEDLLHTAGCAPLSLAPDYGDLETWHTGYDIWREAANYRCSSYMQFAKIGKQDSKITSETDPDLDVLKACLRNGEIVSFSSYCDADGSPWFQTVKIPKAEGVDDELVGQQIATKVHMQSGGMAHMLCVVGYNDNIWVDINKNGNVDKGEKGALKIANSWGESFYNNGFIWLAYDALNEQSAVEGMGYDTDRMIGIESNFYKINVSKAYGASGIFLYYTLNSSNRADNFVEISARRKTDGVTFTKKVTPYNHVTHYTNTVKNYNGTTGFSDGAMVADLNTVIEDLSSDNFHDYDWSIRFADSGTDTNPFTVKEAYILDENTNKSYQLDTAFPIQLNSAEKTVPLRSYYHFAKLYVPETSALTVGSTLKFTFKTANETFGTDPIKYTMTISQNGKEIFSKLHKATSVDKNARSSVIKGTWKPEKPGTYTITITGKDASGVTISRSAAFKVYNKMLAVRSIELDKGKYINQNDNLKMTPLVTGGTAPYTYSYYYIKGGKTVKIVENTKNSYKTKTFGLKTGKYTLLVKVKDAAGTVAQATQTVVVKPTVISRISFSSNYSSANTRNLVTAEISNPAAYLVDQNYEFTFTKDGQTQTINSTVPYNIFWTPQSNGIYQVTCTLKSGDKVLAVRSTNYQVGTTAQQDNSKILIHVNVINYVCNSYNSGNFTIHYWDGNGNSGEAKCVSNGTAIKKNVGFWNSAQTFNQFTAEIPNTSTGYKFHIGNEWFGDTDGSTAASNTVYAFHYDYNRALYPKE